MTEGKKVIDEIIDDLARIPKDITSEINVKDLIKEIEREQGKEMRRRVSYV
jgi:uncharacterized membrane protein